MTAGVIVGTIAVVLVVVVVGLLIDRKHSVVAKPDELRARAKPAATHAAGEAPATAIRARKSQLERLRTQRCKSCRSPMTNEPDDTVRYNDKQLLVLRFACSGCRAKSSLYVEPV